MAETSEIIIIGGGVAGCAVAYHLALAGVKATIIEREGISSQASGYSAGALNPLQGEGIPGPLETLALESFRLSLNVWDTLKSESGINFHPKMVSIVQLAFDELELAQLKATMRIFESVDGFAAEWLQPTVLRSLEPKLADNIFQGLYTSGNAVVNSHLYTTALSKAAENRGTTIRSGTVTGLKKLGQRITGVTLDDGELDCDVVVLATGAWSAEAEKWLGVSIPVKPLKGEILRMKPPQGKTLVHDFSSGEISILSRSDGLIWIGATQESKGFDNRPSMSARKILVEGAIKIIPDMEHAQIVKHTACLRPVTPDWLPIVGRAPGWENVFLATGAGKKGILLSSGMGKAISELITNGSTQLSIGPVNPERFNVAPMSPN